MAIGGYSLCSSTLLLANKMAMEYVPNPTLISFLQVLFATLVVFLIQFLRLDKVDTFEWHKVKPYLLYIFFFFTSIYANMKSLSVSNVETVIVFRACTPIAVCIIEYFFMNRDLPSLKSALSLLAVAGGAVIYCLSDSQLQLEGISAYYWVITYFVLITLEMTYGKNLTSTVKMDSVWGPVLYCNALALLPFMMMAGYEGNMASQIELFLSSGVKGLSVLFFSCVVGTLIG
jgi:drug/metabolite transporter (DMT)-like permease